MALRKSSGLDNRRTFQRLRVDEITEFVDARGNTFGCRIVNMSATGFCIETGAPLRVGDSIYFVRPACRARIAWLRGGKVGVEFLARVQGRKGDPPDMSEDNLF